MAPTLFTGCFTGGDSAGVKALSARRVARESRSRPWLANSILARKSHRDLAVVSGPRVGDAPTTREEQKPGLGLSPAPAGDGTLGSSSSEESLVAVKAAGAALRAKAKSLARTPSRIPRLRTWFAHEEAPKPSHAPALSEGPVSPPVGTIGGHPARPRAGAVRELASSDWVRRVTAAVSSLERKLKAKTARHSPPVSTGSTRVPTSRSQPSSSVVRAGLQRSRRGLAHVASAPLSLGKAFSTLKVGVSSGPKRPKKSILKVKDPSQHREKSCMRPLLDRLAIKRRHRVRFDGWPITFVGTVDAPEDYDRTSGVCWSCNINAVEEGGHDEDCRSYDDDPFVGAPSRAVWEMSQMQLREAQDEALAMASGGAIRC